MTKDELKCIIKECIMEEKAKIDINSPEFNKCLKINEYLSYPIADFVENLLLKLNNTNYNISENPLNYNLKITIYNEKEDLNTNCISKIKSYVESIINKAESKFKGWSFELQEKEIDKNKYRLIIKYIK